MTERLDVQPEVLAKLLLIQSFAGALPGKARMMEFLCSGLRELPGVACAHFEAEPETNEGGPDIPYRIPLRAGEHHHGDIVLTLDSEERFGPYRPYVNNLGFTISVFLEERRQRDIIEEQRLTLERRVEERTRMWVQEVQERETAQQQARQIRQRVEKLESLGILAGGIAHDFNNLLGSIFGFIELALDASSQNPEATKYLERSLEAYGRAVQLTQRLLTFARGGEPRKKISSMRGLLERCLNADSRTEPKLKCELEADQDLWPCEVDEQQMARVIESIVSNAAQAMPEGGSIKIVAENVEGEALRRLPVEHERYLKISITDRGAGISKEHLPRIFDPFFTTKQGAHGLGLAICHSIVRKHQGLISAESNPGLGTTVHIHLPALASDLCDLDN